MNYENKYNKYKLKYLRLKKKIGGMESEYSFDSEYIIDYSSKLWYDTLNTEEPDISIIGILEDIKLKNNINTLNKSNVKIIEEINKIKDLINKDNLIIRILLNEIEYIIENIKDRKLASKISEDKDLDLTKEEKIRYIRILVSNIKLTYLFKVLFIIAKDRENNQLFNIDSYLNLYYLMNTNIIICKVLFQAKEYLFKYFRSVNYKQINTLRIKFESYNQLKLEPKLDDLSSMYEYNYFYRCFSNKKLDEDSIKTIEDKIYNDRFELFQQIQYKLIEHQININFIYDSIELNPDKFEEDFKLNIKKKIKIIKDNKDHIFNNLNIFI